MKTNTVGTIGACERSGAACGERSGAACGERSRAACGERSRTASAWVVVAAVLAAAGAQAAGQVPVKSSTAAHAAAARDFAANVIVPQSRAIRHDHAAGIEVTGVKVGVVILEQAAVTTMDISLRNRSGSRQEAELAVPVPEGAVIKAFTFEGLASELKAAELLPKDEADRVYHQIVAKLRDPALLEFMGCNLIRSSVFPVEANGTQKVRITYEHLLMAEGDRIDYTLPRTESVEYRVPWDISVKIKGKSPIAGVYSPSHELDVKHNDDGSVNAKVAAVSSAVSGAFRLSYLLHREGATATLMAYPDPKGDGGYFLLLAGLPALKEKAATKRELTIVLDRSGSMTGEKIEQARAAALQVLQGLENGEAFNIIDYSDTLSSFAAAPVIRDANTYEAARAYITRLAAGGGTNLHDALLEALRPAPREGMLPLVLFLTDGLATVGVTQELPIRNDVEKANTHKRRLFTFGVGYDVNAPLLSHLATTSRGSATVVQPKENVEAKVSQVFKGLAGPVLVDPVLENLDAQGQPVARASEMLPQRLADVFDGQNIIVMGKYRGAEPLHFRLRGKYAGKERTFDFTFKLDTASVRNSFVARLWASRRIGLLAEEIRQGGAGNPKAAAADPKLKELVDEIVRLSMEFGILTEYTAFLAKDGTDLTKRDAVMAEANGNFVGRAINSRVGVSAVNQSMNSTYMNTQSVANGANEYYDEQMNRVANTRVQQVSDRAFFRRGDRWVDSQALEPGKETAVDEMMTVGSSEYERLAATLAAQHRNGALAMEGEILMRVNGKNVLIKVK